jgi:hypothetical protein
VVILNRGMNMKKGLNIGFALIAVVAMLFTGIVAAHTTIEATLSAPAGTYPSLIGTTAAAPGTYTNPTGTTTATPGTYTNPTGTTTAAPGTYTNPAGSASIWGSTNSHGTQAANTAGYASVAITGVMPMNRENVQLFNFGTSTVNLAGYTLTTQDGARFTLPEATLTPGDEVFVMFQDRGAGYSSSTYQNSASRDALNDDFGYVTLSNDDGYRIASLSYDTPIATQSTSGYYLPAATPGSTSLVE